MKKTTFKIDENNCMILLQNTKGITLIALVITVIVLLILAGAAVSIGLNGESLFNTANEAKSSWNRKVNEEDTVLNGYIDNFDNYIDYIEGPITGTLNLDYDLLADADNTYKKVTLSIDGLEKATDEQILAEAAKERGLSVEQEIEQLNRWAEEYNDSYEDELELEIKTLLIDSNEPRTITVTFNGNNVPERKGSFLATQNGTYKVRVRSASNKVGTIDIVIDGTKIGTTKEESGINEEIFDIPESVDYTDINNAYARIPSGYYVGTSNTINTVENGLVITSSKDANGRSTGDEYVWIPVEDINNMVMCKANNTGTGENKICNIEQLEDGELHCKTHDTTGASNMCGRLYGVGSNTSSSNAPYIYSTSINFGLNTQTFTEDSGYREPDLVKENDKGAYMTAAGVENTDAFKTQMQNDFYEMAKSVAKYKGFWIARYEMGETGGSKRAQFVAREFYNNNSYMWYGLYKISRSIDLDNKIARTMVWGCQHDQVVRHLGLQAQTGHSNIELSIFGCPAAFAPLDKMKNIFDLEANVSERTMEAYGTKFRTLIGANYLDVDEKNFYPASETYAEVETTSIRKHYGTRTTLYVTLPKS